MRRLISILALISFLTTNIGFAEINLAPQLKFGELGEYTPHHKKMSLAEMMLRMQLMGGKDIIDNNPTDLDVIRKGMTIIKDEEGEPDRDTPEELIRYEDTKDKFAPAKITICHNELKQLGSEQSHIFSVPVIVEKSGQADSYTLLFSTLWQEGKDKGYTIVPCRDQEDFEKHKQAIEGLAKQDKLPQREDVDRKSIDRYAQHERYDEVLARAHYEQAAINAEDLGLSLKQIVQKIKEITKVELRSNPAGHVKDFEDRELYIIPFEWVKRKYGEEECERMLTVTIIDKDGQQHEVIAFSHTSNHSIHIFLDEKDIEILKNFDEETREPSYNLSYISNIVRGEIAHEMGAACALPIIRVDPIESLEVDGVIPVNLMDVRYKKAMKFKKIEDVLTYSLVDLDKVRDRDFAQSVVQLSPGAFMETYKGPDAMERKQILEGMDEIFLHSILTNQRFEGSGNKMYRIARDIYQAYRDEQAMGEERTAVKAISSHMLGNLLALLKKLSADDIDAVLNALDMACIRAGAPATSIVHWYYDMLLRERDKKRGVYKGVDFPLETSFYGNVSRHKAVRMTDATTLTIVSETLHDDHRHVKERVLSDGRRLIFRNEVYKGVVGRLEKEIFPDGSFRTIEKYHDNSRQPSKVYEYTASGRTINIVKYDISGRVEEINLLRARIPTPILRAQYAAAMKLLDGRLAANKELSGDLSLAMRMADIITDAYVREVNGSIQAMGEREAQEEREAIIGRFLLLYYAARKNKNLLKIASFMVKGLGNGTISNGYYTPDCTCNILINILRKSCHDENPLTYLLRQQTTETYHALPRITGLFQGRQKVNQVKRLIREEFDDGETNLLLADFQRFKEIKGLDSNFGGRPRALYRTARLTAILDLFYIEHRFWPYDIGVRETVLEALEVQRGAPAERSRNLEREIDTDRERKNILTKLRTLFKEDSERLLFYGSDCVVLAQRIFSAYIDEQSGALDLDKEKKKTRRGSEYTYNILEWLDNIKDTRSLNAILDTLYVSGVFAGADPNSIVYSFHEMIVKRLRIVEGEQADAPGKDNNPANVFIKQAVSTTSDLLRQYRIALDNHKENVAYRQKEAGKYHDAVRIVRAIREAHRWQHQGFFEDENMVRHMEGQLLYYLNKYGKDKETLLIAEGLLRRSGILDGLKDSEKTALSITRRMLECAIKGEDPIIGALKVEKPRGKIKSRDREKAVLYYLTKEFSDDELAFIHRYFVYQRKKNRPLLESYGYGNIEVGKPTGNSVVARYKALLDICGIKNNVPKTIPKNDQIGGDNMLNKAFDLHLRFSQLSDREEGGMKTVAHMKRMPDERLMSVARFEKHIRKALDEKFGRGFCQSGKRPYHFLREIGKIGTVTIDELEPASGRFIDFHLAKEFKKGQYIVPCKGVIHEGRLVNDQGAIVSFGRDGVEVTIVPAIDDVRNAIFEHYRDDVDYFAYYPEDRELIDGYLEHERNVDDLIAKAYKSEENYVEFDMSRPEKTADYTYMYNYMEVLFQSMFKGIAKPPDEYSKFKNKMFASQKQYVFVNLGDRALLPQINMKTNRGHKGRGRVFAHTGSSGKTYFFFDAENFMLAKRMFSGRDKGGYDVKKGEALKESVEKSMVHEWGVRLGLPILNFHEHRPMNELDIAYIAWEHNKSINREGYPHLVNILESENPLVDLTHLRGKNAAGQEYTRDYADTGSGNVPETHAYVTPMDVKRMGVLDGLRKIFYKTIVTGTDNEITENTGMKLAKTIFERYFEEQREAPWEADMMEVPSAMPFLSALRGAKLEDIEFALRAIDLSCIKAGAQEYSIIHWYDEMLRRERDRRYGIYIGISEEPDTMFYGVDDVSEVKRQEDGTLLTIAEDPTYYESGNLKGLKLSDGRALEFMDEVHLGINIGALKKETFADRSYREIVSIYDGTRIPKEVIEYTPSGRMVQAVEYKENGDIKRIGIMQKKVPTHILRKQYLAASRLLEGRLASNPEFSGDLSYAMRMVDIIADTYDMEMKGALTKQEDRDAIIGRFLGAFYRVRDNRNIIKMVFNSVERLGIGPYVEGTYRLDFTCNKLIMILKEAYMNQKNPFRGLLRVELPAGKIEKRNLRSTAVGLIKSEFSSNDLELLVGDFDLWESSGESYSLRPRALYRMTRLACVLDELGVDRVLFRNIPFPSFNADNYIMVREALEEKLTTGDRGPNAYVSDIDHQVERNSIPERANRLFRYTCERIPNISPDGAERPLRQGMSLAAAEMAKAIFNAHVEEQIYHERGRRKRQQAARTKLLRRFEVVTIGQIDEALERLYASGIFVSAEPDSVVHGLHEMLLRKRKCLEKEITEPQEHEDPACVKFQQQVPSGLGNLLRQRRIAIEDVKADMALRSGERYAKVLEIVGLVRKIDMLEAEGRISDDTSRGTYLAKLLEKLQLVAGDDRIISTVSNILEINGFVYSLLDEAKDPAHNVVYRMISLAKDGKDPALGLLGRPGALLNSLRHSVKPRKEDKEKMFVTSLFNWFSEDELDFLVKYSSKFDGREVALVYRPGELTNDREYERYYTVARYMALLDLIEIKNPLPEGFISASKIGGHDTLNIALEMKRNCSKVIIEPLKEGSKIRLRTTAELAPLPDDSLRTAYLFASEARSALHERFGIDAIDENWSAPRQFLRKARNITVKNTSEFEHDDDPQARWVRSIQFDKIQEFKKGRFLIPCWERDLKRGIFKRYHIHLSWGTNGMKTVIVPCYRVGEASFLSESKEYIDHYKHFGEDIKLIEGYALHELYVDDQIESVYAQGEDKYAEVDIKDGRDGYVERFIRETFKDVFMPFFESAGESKYGDFEEKVLKNHKYVYMDVGDSRDIREIKVRDVNGNESSVWVRGHTGPRGKSYFLSSTKRYELFKQWMKGGGQHEGSIDIMGLMKQTIKSDLIHEWGVRLGLPILEVRDDLPVNELDLAYEELAETKSITIEKYPHLAKIVNSDNPLVDMRQLRGVNAAGQKYTRDYAAGGGEEKDSAHPAEARPAVPPLNREALAESVGLDAETAKLLIEAEDTIPEQYKTFPVHIERLRDALNEVPAFSGKLDDLDQKSGIIFSNKAVFGNADDADEVMSGIGILLIQLAIARIKVGIVVNSKNDKQAKIVDYLNERLKWLGSYTSICKGDSAFEVHSQLDVPRSYYFALTNEDDEDFGKSGITRLEISDIARDIIDRLGDMCAIKEAEALEKMKEAAHKFAQAA